MSPVSLRGACVALLILLIAICAGLLLDGAGEPIWDFPAIYSTLPVALCFGGLGYAARTLRDQASPQTPDEVRPSHAPSLEIREIVSGVVLPLAPSSSRLHISGPSIRVPSETATFLALVLHELATDALRHGAWRGITGSVELTWRRKPETTVNLEIHWREHSAPTPGTPSGRSFGRTLIERGVTGASMDCKSLPGGLLCVIRIDVLIH